MRGLFTLLLFCLTATAGYAQIVPDAPVENFKYPMFTPDGMHKAWDFGGAEGIYRGEETIEVKEMVLRVFSEDQRPRVLNTIRSPHAVIQIDTQTAQGDGPIEVEAETFELQGADWTWKGDSVELTIRQDVKFDISGSLGVILK